MMTNTGQTYLIIKTKIFFLRKACPSIRTSETALSMVIRLVIKRQMQSAAMGIITEFVRKSKKSRNCIPMIVTLESGP